VRLKLSVPDRKYGWDQSEAIETDIASDSRGASVRDLEAVFATSAERSAALALLESGHLD
jgi:hypothetical protein